MRQFAADENDISKQGGGTRGVRTTLMYIYIIRRKKNVKVETSGLSSVVILLRNIVFNGPFESITRCMRSVCLHCTWFVAELRAVVGIPCCLIVHVSRVCVDFVFHWWDNICRYLVFAFRANAKKSCSIVRRIELSFLPCGFNEVLSSLHPTSNQTDILWSSTLCGR